MHGRVRRRTAPIVLDHGIEEVLATVEPRIKRLLDRRGLGDGDDDGSASDAWADEAPVLAGLAAASVQGIVALGPQRGARLRLSSSSMSAINRRRPPHLGQANTSNPKVRAIRAAHVWPRAWRRAVSAGRDLRPV